MGTYQKFLEIDKKPVCLNVVDTAGQEDYMAMRDSWLRAGDGFVMVFSLVDANSFREIKGVKDQINEAKELNRPYIETSAKTAENVEKVFHEVVRQCRAA